MMPKNLLTVFFWIILSLGLSACGNKNKLNIPPTPPVDALQAEFTPEKLLRLGQRLEAAGDLNSAGNFYTDAIAADNTLVEAHLGLGRIFSQIGQNNLAAASYGIAFELDQDNYQALKGYLLGLLDNDGQGVALDAIERYLEGNSPSAELLNFKGLAHDLNGELVPAEAAFRQGLLLTTPGERLHGTLLGNLALSLGLSGRTSAAILLLNPFVGDLRKGLEGLSSYRSSLRQNLALVYALAGNPESAVEVAKSALSPEDAEFNRTFYEAVAKLFGPAQVKAVFLGILPPDYNP